MSNVVTKLDRLNQLLDKSSHKFQFPAFRAHISASGANQDWILKAVKRHGDVDPEITALLALPFKKLLTPHKAE